MRLHSTFVAFAFIVAAGHAVSATSGIGGGPGRDSGAARDEALYSDLCRGSDLCRQVVLIRRDGVTLLRVSFIHSARFVADDEDFCDAREYWYINGQSRVLLTRDCAEQWGADSRGPVQPMFDGKQLQLAYVQWQASDGCERAIATVEWRTGKVLSTKRWTGRSRAQRTECAQQKAMKVGVHQGAGSAADPLLDFQP